MSNRWVLVFDWDGTLVDTLEIKIRNAGELFAQVFGLDPGMVEAAYRRSSGLPRRQLFEAIGETFKIPAFSEETFQSLSLKFSARNRAAFAHLERERLVSPDTLHTLETLSARGYPLFVSSAADPTEVRQLAEALGIERFFAGILGSEPGFTKGIDHLGLIQEKCNASFSQIVFIGDEPADILLGKQAGVLTVVKAGTHTVAKLAEAGAEFVIASLGELIPWLDRERIAKS